MKSSSEIAESVAQTVSNIYLRPSMHVGISLDADGCGEALDSLLWHLHSTWCTAQDRDNEFREVVNNAHQHANCGCLAFAGAFRHQNPESTDKACTEFVLHQWQLVSQALDVPLVDFAGKTVPRVS